MVTQKVLEKYKDAKEEIAQEEHMEPKDVEKVINNLERRIVNNRRQPRPPAPEGSIMLMDASRKYKIPAATLSDWLRYGWLKLIVQRGKFKYILESDVRNLANIKRHAGLSTMRNLSDDVS